MAKQATEEVVDLTMSEMKAPQAGGELNGNNPLDPLREARQAGNTWIFRDKEYELFLVNGEGGATIKLLVPGSDEPMGIVSANFMWEKSAPFFDHLDWGFRNVTDLNTNVNKEEADNVVIRDCKLFRELLQGGEVIEIDEYGNQTDPQQLTRKELLELLEPEYQSDLISKWLGAFHIERYVEKGQSRLMNFLKAETIKFVCRIGNYDNPRHVLLFEFKKPSSDTRRDYENKAVVSEKEQEGNVVKKYLVVDNEYKYRFVRNHFLGVQGVTIGDIGKPFEATDSATVAAFRKGFVPTWWVRLADALANTFSNVGKH